MWNSLPQHQCLRARSKALLGPRCGRDAPPGASSGVLGDAVKGGGSHPLLGCRGKGDVACLCLSYFLIARSDEVFASDSGVVHPAHCLTRGGVASFAGDVQLGYTLWPTADKIEVRVWGHKGDQDQIGSVRVRT